MAIRNDLSVRRPGFALLAGGGLSKPSVVSMPSPNQSARPGGAGDIDTIVLHHTASTGSAQDVGRYFDEPSAQVSSHYIVGKDGTLVQCVPDAAKAWHAGKSTFKGRDNVNDFSLGIEIVNAGDGKDPYPDAQYDALANLVAWMMQTYHVPMDRITGHKDIALPKGRKTDPSSNFDLDRLEKLVSQRLNGTPAAPRPPLQPPSNLPDHWIYQVKGGDTLTKIARDQLGDENRWPEIYGLNHDQLTNPNLIFPGQRLRMPARKGKPTPPIVRPPDPVLRPVPPVADPAPVAPPATRPTPPAVQPRPVPPPIATPSQPPLSPPVPARPPVAPVPPRPPMGDSFDLGAGIRMGGAAVGSYVRSGASLEGGLAGGFMHGGGSFWRGGSASGGMIDGAAGGFMKGGFLSGLKDALPRLLKSNFVISAGFAAVSNLVDLARHRVTGKQAAVGFAVDTVAYTGIGAASTYLGGMIGSLLGPIGTLGGVLAGGVLGMGLSWLYEKFARKKAVDTLSGESTP